MDLAEVNKQIKLVKKVGGKSDHALEYRPRVGVIILSDGVAAGKSEDKSGVILFYAH